MLSDSNNSNWPSVVLTAPSTQNRDGRVDGDRYAIPLSRNLSTSIIRRARRTLARLDKYMSGVSVNSGIESPTGSTNSESFPRWSSVVSPAPSNSEM